MPGHFPESMLVFIHSGIPGVCLISDHASSLLLSAGFFIDLAQSNIMTPLNQTERLESRKRISGRLPHGMAKTDKKDRLFNMTFSAGTASGGSPCGEKNGSKHSSGM